METATSQGLLARASQASLCSFRVRHSLRQATRPCSVPGGQATSIRTTPISFVGLPVFSQGWALDVPSEGISHTAQPACCLCGPWLSCPCFSRSPTHKPQEVKSPGTSGTSRVPTLAGCFGGRIGLQFCFEATPRDDQDLLPALGSGIMLLVLGVPRIGAGLAVCKALTLAPS